VPGCASTSRYRFVWNSRMPAVRSCCVLTRWQSVHSHCTLSRVSVPPAARLTVWSSSSRSALPHHAQRRGVARCACRRSFALRWLPQLRRGIGVLSLLIAALGAATGAGITRRAQGGGHRGGRELPAVSFIYWPAAAVMRACSPALRILVWASSSSSAACWDRARFVRSATTQFSHSLHVSRSAESDLRRPSRHRRRASAERRWG